MFFLAYTTEAFGIYSSLFVSPVETIPAIDREGKQNACSFVSSNTICNLVVLLDNHIRRPLGS